MDVQGTIAFWFIIIIMGFPPLVLPWGTSLEHPNKVYRYVKTCHLDTTYKFTFPCHLATMVSFSLKLGF